MADGDIKQRFIVEYDGKKLEMFTADLKNVKKTSEDAGKGVESSTDKMVAGFGKAAVAIAAVAAAVKAAKIGVELGELGAQVMTVDKNFQQFARRGGGDSIYMMDKLRKASGGMMNDMVLQQNAMKAMISGIEFDDMIVAMEYVRKYALATGGDVNQLMTTTMTGLARGSAQFMDDIGIQVMGAKDVVGASIDQMKKKVGEFADSTGDVSSQLSNLKTGFANLKQELGKALVPALEQLIETANIAVVSLRGIVAVFDKEGLQNSKDKMAAEAQISALNRVIAQSEPIIQKQRSAIESLNKEYKNGKIDSTEYGVKHANMTARLNRDLKSIEESRKKVAKLSSTVDIGTGKAPKKIGGGPVGKTSEELAKEAREAANKKLEAQEKYWNFYVRERDHFEQVKRLTQEIANTARVSSDLKLGGIPSFADATGLGGKTMFGNDRSKLGTQSQVNFDPPETSLDKLKSFMDEYGSIVQSGMSTVGDIFNAVYSKQAEDIQYAAQAQIDAVNSSTKSEKQKAKEIKKINEQARKDAHETRLKEWRAQIFMSIANTALGVTAALPKGGIPLAIATGVIGAINTGIIASNKPRYYYGSRDSSGAYTTVGGNSSGDTVPALLKSNEMVVSGKSNVQKAQNAINGGGTGGNVNMSFPISFAVSGSVDRSTADYMIGRVESTVKNIIENNRYTNLINTAFA